MANKISFPGIKTGDTFRFGRMLFAFIVFINMYVLGLNFMIRMIDDDCPEFHDCFIAWYVPTYDHRFGINTDEVNPYWTLHMILLSVEAFVLACVWFVMKTKYKKDVKDYIERIAKSHNIDPVLLNTMINNVVPGVVKKDSKETAVFFEMLTDGCLKDVFASQQLKLTDKQLFDVASKILSAHLQSHPEDMKKVLSVFIKKSLPKDIVKQYTQNKGR